MAKLKDGKKKLEILAGNTNKIDMACKVDQSYIRVENEETHERKTLRNKKRKKYQTAETESIRRDKNSDSAENGFTEQHGRADEVKESTKRKPKKKKSEKETKPPVDEVDIDTEKIPRQGNSLKRVPVGKSRKANRKKTMEVEAILQKRDDVEEEIYQISGDEDCSKGMKKWIMEYHQQRPGLKVLLERIDDFITAHEAKEEQERLEREARAAEDGWTVVTHHKGRKKTTNAETGVVVGSVTQAAVLDKMAKEKGKEVGLGLYLFQKREAQKNEKNRVEIHTSTRFLSSVQTTLYPFVLHGRRTKSAAGSRPKNKVCVARDQQSISDSRVSVEQLMVNHPHLEKYHRQCEN